MKYNFSLAMITIFLILISMTNAIRVSNIPNAGDVLTEYYTQKGVNEIIESGSMRSDIERHPSKYVILNGQSAEMDPNMKTGQIKENDPSPYYPYYDSSKHPDSREIFANKMKQRNQSKQVIYQKDQQAYYGPSHQFTVHEKAPSSELKVKVILGDLSKVIPNENNLLQLEKELDILNQKIKAEADGNKLNEQNKVYNKDSLAYYDPTSTDLLEKKAKLEKNILDLKLNLKQNDLIERNLNPIIVEKQMENVVTQNKLNGDVESSNKAIADNYFYPAGTSSKIVVFNEPITSTQKVDLGEVYKIEKTLTEPVKKIEVVGDKIEKIENSDKIEKMNKTDVVEIENIDKGVVDNATKTEAESKNEKQKSLDETSTKTEAKSKNEIESESEDKTEELKKVENNLSKRNDSFHKLDTQGLKTERVRIISLRKHN